AGASYAKEGNGMYLPHSSYDMTLVRAKSAGRLGFRAAFSAERNPACVQTVRAAQEASGGPTSPEGVCAGRNAVSPRPKARRGFPGAGVVSRSTNGPYVPVHEVIRPFQGRNKTAV